MLARLLAFSLAGLGTGSAHSDASSLRDSVPHITMSGTASMQVVPDIAVLYLAVVNERADAAAATQATSKAAHDLVADIKAHGIDDKDIEATFTLEALVDTKSDEGGRAIESKLRGYRAQEYIDVTVRDAKTAGSLARRFIGAGAVQLRSASYFISKQKELTRGLDAAAFRDALGKRPVSDSSACCRSATIHRPSRAMAKPTCRRGGGGRPKGRCRCRWNPGPKPCRRQSQLRGRSRAPSTDARRLSWIADTFTHLSRSPPLDRLGIDGRHAGLTDAAIAASRSRLSATGL